MFRYLLLFLVALLYSCSSVEKRDCSSLDWHEQGVKDGKDGRRSTYFLQHALKCSRKPNEEKYKVGRKEGLKFFCTSYGGFKDGVKGMAYFGQCRSFPYEDKFKTAHSLGMDVFRQNEENLDNIDNINELERKISSEFHSGDDLNDLKFDKSILEKDLLRGKGFYKNLMQKAKSRKYLTPPKSEE